MGARMIIIECIIDQADKEYEYYDAGNVLRYTVDPKKPLDLEELAASIRRIDGDSSSSQSWFSTSQVKEPGKYQMIREEMQRHLHELTYFEELPRNVERSTCQKCRQAVSSGPIHWCTECQEEFILHKSCAELPDKSPEQVLENCPTDLKSRTPKHNFPQKRICQVCDFGKKGFSDDCFDCLIQTHLECGFLPTVFNSLRHEHPLNFVITPMSYNYEYQCCACDDFGKLISHKCYKCDYDLHIDCALDSDTKKIVLRHQVQDEHRNAEDWMLEYALQATAAKLAPARKRKVELLVEAFETVLPQQAID